MVEQIRTNSACARIIELVKKMNESPSSSSEDKELLIGKEYNKEDGIFKVLAVNITTNDERSRKLWLLEGILRRRTADFTSARQREKIIKEVSGTLVLVEAVELLGLRFNELTAANNVLTMSVTLDGDVAAAFEAILGFSRYEYFGCRVDTSEVKGGGGKIVLDLTYEDFFVLESTKVITLELVTEPNPEVRYPRLHEVWTCKANDVEYLVKDNKLISSGSDGVMIRYSLVGDKQDYVLGIKEFVNQFRLSSLIK